MPDDWDLPEGQTQYGEVDELKARLAEVTAERDRLDKLYVGEMKEVARLEDELADVGLYLDKLLRAVETDIMGAKRLAAKIRKERS